MYTVTIHKRFVSGFLQGLTANASVNFQNQTSAETYTRWAESHKRNPVQPCAGLSQYVIESFTVERVDHAA